MTTNAFHQAQLGIEVLWLIPMEGRTSYVTTNYIKYDLFMAKIGWKIRSNLFEKQSRIGTQIT